MLYQDTPSHDVRFFFIPENINMLNLQLFDNAETSYAILWAFELPGMLDEVHGLAPHQSCPLCRREIGRDSVLNVNVALNSLTRNLLVACANDDCEWVDTYGKAEDHAKQYPKRKVEWSNDGCQHTLKHDGFSIKISVQSMITQVNGYFSRKHFGIVVWMVFFEAHVGSCTNLE